MDYRELQLKYGNAINKLLTNQDYIDFLITVLNNEGFGEAKQVVLLDGFKTQAIKLSENASIINYQINVVDVEIPSITYVIDQANTYEWGAVLNPVDLTVTLTVTRKTYNLYSLVFSAGLDEADKVLAEINAAGVNANLNVDYVWTLSNIPSLSTLVNGGTLIGTVRATDDKGQVVISSISIQRSNRWIWGLTRGTKSSSAIASAISNAVSGNITSSDDNVIFYQLTTGTGTFPNQVMVDTFGEEKTFFAINISTQKFTLDDGRPLSLPNSVEGIDTSLISGGVANVTRNYVVQILNLNTVLTINKV